MNNRQVIPELAINTGTTAVPSSFEQLKKTNAKAKTRATTFTLLCVIILFLWVLSP